MEEAERWSPPGTFDGFVLEGAIGHGGMGSVYLAHEASLDRRVAIKFITGARPGRAARERFLIEARAVARLTHPNVVAIYRIGEVEGRPYIASEYVAGTSLERVTKPLPWGRLLAVASAVARGLAEAHRRGVLHRDIKPANVLLGDDGAVKLVDFGLAKLDEVDAASAPSTKPPSRPPSVPALDPKATVPEGIGFTTSAESPQAVSQTVPLSTRLADFTGKATVTGVLMGTPLFLSPEVWSGERATPRSDVYAAGLLLYELSTGSLPFAHLSGESLVHHIREVGLPPLGGLRRDVPRAFSEAVDKATARDPHERFGTAAELADALAAVEAVHGSFERVASGGPADDAALVSASFARVHGRIDALFAAVYEAMFRRDPSLRILFPVDMAEQRAKLAATVRLAIESLRAPERLVPHLEDLGRRHLDYGVLPKHLRVFEETVVECLSEYDRENWDERTAAAWKHSLAAIALAMTQGMSLRAEPRSA